MNDSVLVFHVQIQEQIIEDIMGLEEKFGDTLGLPYLESNMITPQTVCYSFCNTGLHEYTEHDTLPHSSTTPYHIAQPHLTT